MVDEESRYDIYSFDTEMLFHSQKIGRVTLLGNNCVTLHMHFLTTISLVVDLSCGCICSTIGWILSRLYDIFF